MTGDGVTTAGCFGNALVIVVSVAIRIDGRAWAVFMAEAVMALTVL
jgi:hypothetical protein